MELEKNFELDESFVLECDDSIGFLGSDRSDILHQHKHINKKQETELPAIREAPNRPPILPKVLGLKTIKRDSVKDLLSRSIRSNMKDPVLEMEFLLHHILTQVYRNIQTAYTGQW